MTDLGYEPRLLRLISRKQIKKTKNKKNVHVLRWDYTIVVMHKFYTIFVVLKMGPIKKIVPIKFFGVR